jgi:crotonobetainyl-CoA:carnitine CoA-transferase CaiB-like acyl-CoA transferase
VAGRQTHGDELQQRLAAIIATRTAADWEAFGATHGLPLVRVRSVAEALADQHRGAPAPDFAVRVDGARLPAAASDAPALGADTDAVLGAIGYDAAGLASLRAAGVLPSSPTEPA